MSRVTRQTHLFLFFFHLIKRIRIRNKIDEKLKTFFFKSSPSQLSRATTPSPPHGPHRSFSHHSLSCSLATALCLLPFSTLPLSLCKETLRTFSAMSSRANDQSLCEETLGLISHACREWGFFQVVNHGLQVSAEWGFFRYVGSGYGFLE